MFHRACPWVHTELRVGWEEGFACVGGAPRWPVPMDFCVAGFWPFLPNFHCCGFYVAQFSLEQTVKQIHWLIFLVQSKFSVGRFAVVGFAVLLVNFLIYDWNHLDRSWVTICLWVSLLIACRFKISWCSSWIGFRWNGMNSMFLQKLWLQEIWVPALPCPVEVWGGDSCERVIQTRGGYRQSCSTFLHLQISGCGIAGALWQWLLSIYNFNALAMHLAIWMAFAGPHHRWQKDGEQCEWFQLQLFMSSSCDVQFSMWSVFPLVPRDFSKVNIVVRYFLLWSPHVVLRSSTSLTHIVQTCMLKIYTPTHRSPFLESFWKSKTTCKGPCTV